MNVKDELEKIKYMSQRIIYLLNNKEFYEKCALKYTAIKLDGDNCVEEIKKLCEMRQKMGRYLEQLPKPEYCNILFLRYFGGYTFKIISQHMHYDQRYCMEIHDRAIRALEELIENAEKSEKTM